MKRLLVLSIALVLLTLALSACASADDGAVRQVVTDEDRAVESTLDAQSTAASIDSYFATPAEGANDTGLGNTLGALRALLNDHVSGASRVELTNFRITQVEVHSEANLARVQYQVDLTIVHGDQNGSATVTQDLALLKTRTRGWRISGGDAPQLSNVVGQLP